jgi:hypothetical protein
MNMAMATVMAAQIIKKHTAPKTKTDSPWIWDPTRKKYYYVPTGAQYYIYEDGTQLAFATPRPENTVDTTNPLVGGETSYFGTG